MAAQSEVGLRQVREDELDSLKERLALDLPQSFGVYGPVSLAARYGLHSIQPSSIFVPACPRPSSFTVILSHGNLAVFWRPEEHTAEDVAQYFSRLPDLDWSQPVLIPALPITLVSSLQSLDNVGGRRVRLQTKHPGYLYNLEAPVSLDNELPPVYHVTRLREEDASTVWTHYEFNHFISEDTMRHDIIQFPSVGIRERGSQQQEAQETLVSWIRTCSIGWIGNTFTLPQHRRQGLAGVATVTLAHQMLQEGLKAYLGIEACNTASVKFHERLGFRRQCDIVLGVLLPADAADL